ncbi:MAG: hypothetical protein H7Z74_15300 [Anaerolineae bacterium]|nr:hypothetical protein [Gemmatimonadaceae bacterium]
MSTHAWWLTPLAVLLVLFLFRFVGCDRFFGLERSSVPDDPVNAYAIVVQKSMPVGYWRLHETMSNTAVPGGTAIDEVGNNHGTYDMVQAGFPADPPHLSPGANPIILALGVTPAVQKYDPTATAIRVQGGFVQIPFASELNPSTFSVIALVQAEWALNQPGVYYCVMESSDQPPNQSGARKTRGFAIYAGPDDPAQPGTPFRWQLWVGDGTQFNRVSQVDPTDAATITSGEPTFLAVVFDGSEYEFWVVTENTDMDHMNHALVPQTYVPNNSGDLHIGITQVRSPLVPPFPGSARRLYPFSGKIEEVAIFNFALDHASIASQIVAAFNSP